MRKLGTKEQEEKKIEAQSKKRMWIFGISGGLIFSAIFFLMTGNIVVSIILAFAIPAAVFIYFYFLKQLRRYRRTKKMEEVFPDFLQLMSSNLRAGITIDRSMLLSIREEFDPLDKEIQKTGREIATGKSMEIALLNMAKRIGSEKIRRTIMLIISGMRAGGNLATLLEQTATNMKESDFVEKKASSNVLMYVIFIFVAVAVGAPMLFALSTVLVETLTTLLSGIPVVEDASLPFTMSSVSVSVTFIKYFAIVFMFVIDILAALILGLVSKGEEREGMRYLLPILIISFTIFFVVRLVLGHFMAGLFA